MEFLDQNNDHAACVTNGFLIDHKTGYKRKHFRSTPKSEFSTADLLNGNPFLTCTIMYRKKIFSKVKNILNKIEASDYATHIIASKFGNIGYIDDIGAVYRLHEKGVWQSKEVISAFNFSLRSAIRIRKHILYEIPFKWTMNKYIGRLRGKLSARLFQEGLYFKSLCQSLICFLYPLPSMRYRLKISKQIIVVLLNLIFCSKSN